MAADFQWSTMSPMAPYFKVVEDGNLQFTTRWTGYIFSSLAQEYSFHTKLAGPDDRVKLWIDSKLVLRTMLKRGSTNMTEE